MTLNQPQGGRDQRESEEHSGAPREREARAVSTLLERFMRKVVPGENGCLVWTGAKKAFGYGRISCDGKARSAHRVAFEIHNGYPAPHGMDIMHSCDNPACVNPNHLSAGTRSENIADMMQKGRGNRGARIKGAAHPRAKLTLDQVKYIRSSELSANRLAREFFVSQRTILSVRRGTSYRPEWGN